MAVGVEVLNLGVVCPLVRHVEGRLDRAPVGVVTLSEEILVELLIKVIDGIIEGQEDKLGDLVRFETSGNISSSTIAILKDKSKLV